MDDMDSDVAAIIFIIVTIGVVGIAGTGSGQPPDAVIPGSDHSDDDNRGAEVCIDTFGVTVGCGDSDDGDDTDGGDDSDGDEDDSAPPDSPDTTPVAPEPAPEPDTETAAPPLSTPDETITRGGFMTTTEQSDETETNPSSPTDTRSNSGSDPVVGDADEAEQSVTNTPTPDESVEDESVGRDGSDQVQTERSTPSTESVPSDANTTSETATVTTDETDTQQTIHQTESSVNVGSPTPTLTSMLTTDTGASQDTPDTSASIPLAIPIGLAGIGALFGGAMYTYAYSTSPLSWSVIDRVKDCIGVFVSWLGRIGWIIGETTDDGEILLNNTSMGMLETIESQPGVTPSEISETLDVSVTTVYHSAGKLAEGGLIIEEKRYGNRRYFTDEYRGDENRIERVLMNMPETTEQVLQVVHMSGGVSNKDIAQHIDRSPSTVSHHLNRLEDNALVDRTDDTDNGTLITIDDDVIRTLDEFYK